MEPTKLSNDQPFTDRLWVRVSIILIWLFTIIGIVALAVGLWAAWHFVLFIVELVEQAKETNPA